MSTFKEMGFLSDSAENATAEFAEKFAPWKKLYYALNAFAMSQLPPKVQVHNHDIYGLMIITYYYRAITIYQSAFLLLERGNDTEARALLRVLIETVFVLTATFKDKSFAQKYLVIDERKRITLVKGLLAIHSQLRQSKKPSILSKEAVSEMNRDVQQYKQNIAADITHPLHVHKNEESISIEELAEMAGLTSLYKQHYAYLCQYVHPSPNGMRHYLEVSPKGSVVNLAIGLRVDEAEADMRVAIVVMLAAIAPFGDYFSLALEDEITGFNEQLKSVIAQSHTQTLHVE